LHATKVLAIKKGSMTKKIDLHEAILNAWKTTNRTTVFLIENVPAELWTAKPEKFYPPNFAEITECRRKNLSSNLGDFVPLAGSAEKALFFFKD
jgi:hypothetical protein